ncbi:MAG: hypothetical protein ABI772_09395 [Bacteroidota bacterium]
MSEFRIIPSSKLDKLKYDRCISGDVSSTSFVESWFMDATAGNWMVIADDDYKTVFPFSVRNKWGINYIYQPFFNRMTGIYGEDKTGLENAILGGLLNDYRFWDFYCECRLNNSDAVSSPRIYQSLSLKDTYELLYENYSSKMRRNLRLAEKENMEVRTAAVADDFVMQFRKYTAEKINVLKDADYERLQQLTEKCMQQKNTIYIEAFSEKEKTAGALFTVTDFRILYIEGYSSPKGRTIRSMHVLFDHVIRKFAGSGRILDFGGSNIESIAGFFHSFGAKDQSYFHVYRNKLPQFVKWLKEIRN